MQWPDGYFLHMLAWLGGIAAEAVRLALKDWLPGLGLLKHRDGPEGANGPGMDSYRNPW